MIIEKLAGNIQDIAPGDRTPEKVILDRDRLSKPHQKVTSESGEVYALSLEHGEHLESGSVIYADEDKVVYIELAPEDALVIYPEGFMQWARAAYNIGNMHQTAFIQEECIITPYDSIMESIMQRLEVPCERAQKPIDGVRANVSQQGHHHHHHDHEHQQHDHDHEGMHAHTHEHLHDHDHAQDSDHRHGHDSDHSQGDDHA